MMPPYRTANLLNGYPHILVSTPWTIIRIALPSPPFDRYFSENGHSNLLGRDSSEVEPGRRFDTVDRGGIEPDSYQLFAQRSHLTLAADKCAVGHLDSERLL